MVCFAPYGACIFSFAYFYKHLAPNGATWTGNNSRDFSCICVYLRVFAVPDGAADARRANTDLNDVPLRGGFSDSLILFGKEKVSVRRSWRIVP